MLFNSTVFLIYLPIVLLVYYALSHRWQNAWLLGCSYFFYGWWDWRFCSLLAISTIVDYVCAIRMDEGPVHHRRRWLQFSIMTNLGILGFFKYFNFFIDTAAELLAVLGFQAHLPTLRIILPVGISFYTFQTMSYTIDVYRGDLKATRNFLDFSLYVAFFPQLVAGPIERATHLLKQFAAPRVVTRGMIEGGCFLMLVGYFRKVVIADGVAPLVNTIFGSAANAGWIELLAGAALFAIQIYGDFAGYSDIARGASRLLGIELMINFRQPYLSQNITEFWRRWHISLSTWLRDYLYIPLGGNRGGTVQTYRNLIITMLLGGLWHGARWNFVIWGGLHGLYLAVHKWMLTRRGRRISGDEPMRWGSIPNVLCTFCFVCVAWVFFRASTLHEAMTYFQGIATLRNTYLIPSLLLVKLVFYGVLVALTDWPAYSYKQQEGMLNWAWPVRGVAYALMLFALILLKPTDDTPFLYFQF